MAVFEADPASARRLFQEATDADPTMVLSCRPVDWSVISVTVPEIVSE
jgi:hypothetical protein